MSNQQKQARDKSTNKIIFSIYIPKEFAFLKTWLKNETKRRGCSVSNFVLRRLLRYYFIVQEVSNPHTKTTELSLARKLGGDNLTKE